MRIVEKAAGLPAQFGAKEVEKACGGSPSGTLDRWLKRKWIKRVGTGVYERTQAWPGEWPIGERKPGANVTVPGLDKDPRPLGERLEEALKDRDQARARGQDTLAGILQDKVDKLQGELNRVVNRGER